MTIMFQRVEEFADAAGSLAAWLASKGRLVSQ